MSNGTTPAGWYQDPTGQGESRYWNGTSWTQSVSHGGVTSNVPIDPAQAEQPPVPGTQMAPPATAAQPTTVVEQSSHSALGTIIGVVVALVAVVVILAFIGDATSEDSPPPGSGPAPTEAPAEEPPAEGG